MLLFTNGCVAPDVLPSESEEEEMLLNLLLLLLFVLCAVCRWIGLLVVSLLLLELRRWLDDCLAEFMCVVGCGGGAAAAWADGGW